MLNVGIIQMQSTPLKVEENLSLVENLIVQAAEDGAQLVVLPEMFNVGYYLGEELMSVAERLEEGKTVTWLKSQAARLGLYIVTSLYERYEGHFYNTMVMAGSDGSLQYYRKRNPSLSEIAVWRRSPAPGPGIFDTPLGRIGGAICFDSFTRETFEGFKRSAVELVVIVACWGMPRPAKGRPDMLLSLPILRLSQNLASETAPYQYAIRLNVPVVFVNQGGMTRTTGAVPPSYPWPLPQVQYDFHGNSHIRNAAGEVLARASSTDTAFCAVVAVDVKPAVARPEITRVDIPPRYLSADYYFFQAPRRDRFVQFLGKLMQEWGVSGLQKEYEARRARHTE
ncbi:MAG: carbon-nitrogen hydrolase family protein [Anaerolineales bacterium]|nr:carbon-nitrogen hydrolase family protein [Anaerolineales bacterium]